MLFIITNESAERRREADKATALIEPKRESVVYAKKFDRSRANVIKDKVREQRLLYHLTSRTNEGACFNV